MNIKLKKSIKNSIIIVFAFCIVISAAMIIKDFFATEEITTQSEIYSYNIKPKIKYSVKLFNNILYPDMYQPENLTYISKLTDSIILDIGILLQSSGDFPAKIEYSVDAIVSAAYPSSIENIQGIKWQKIFPLRNTKKKSISSGKTNDILSLEFSLKEYEEFAKKARDLIGHNMDTYVSVMMTGNITIYGPNGEITIPINSGISIPLIQDFFYIIKTGEENIHDTYVETYIDVVDKKISIIKLTSLIFIILVCVSAIIFIIKCIKEPCECDLINKKVKNILKHYSSRIVMLSTYDEASNKHVFDVNSIDDLIKVSDEIERPVLYCINHNSDDLSDKFYIEDENNIFIYTVSLNKRNSYDTYNSNNLNNLCRSDSIENIDNSEDNINTCFKGEEEIDI